MAVIKILAMLYRLSVNCHSMQIVLRSSLYNYAKESTEFNDVLEMIKARQKIELINKGG